ncbi:hypothetical protein IV102_31810 [bacterium]|nr:hypothetical protein [bacterium]
MKVSQQQMLVRYQPQDPLTTPAVEVRVDSAPTLSNDRISVQDRVETVKPDSQGNFLCQPGTAEFHQVNTFVIANRTLNVFEKALGHKIPWAFQGDLKIHPHYDEGFNAFYLRQDHSLNFFDGFDKTLGKTVAGSESLDVVSHETGHAILDGLRPGLMGWFGSGEAPAFHESFGDMAAMLTALQDDGVLDRVCAETGGDLHKPNVVSRLAEEMSQGINHTYLQGTRPENWVMRDANNDFLYLKPESLPENAPPEVLASEPHSFSRIFTGAFWDVLSGVSDHFRQQGQDPRQALISSRDVMARLLARTVELGPNRLNRLSQMGQAMIEADRRYFQSEYADIIEKTLQARNLVPQSSPKSPTFSRGQTPTNLSEADRMLETRQTGPKLPDDLKAQALWKNDLGETFIRYDAIREVDLDPKTCTDLAASLTVAMDDQGKVFHALWEPVDETSIELARQEVDGCLKSDRGYIAQPGQGREKLIKVPIAYANPVKAKG